MLLTAVLKVEVILPNISEYAFCPKFPPHKEKPTKNVLPLTRSISAGHASMQHRPQGRENGGQNVPTCEMRPQRTFVRRPANLQNECSKHFSPHRTHKGSNFFSQKQFKPSSLGRLEHCGDREFPLAHNPRVDNARGPLPHKPRRSHSRSDSLRVQRKNLESLSRRRYIGTEARLVESREYADKDAPVRLRICARGRSLYGELFWELMRDVRKLDFFLFDAFYWFPLDRRQNHIRLQNYQIVTKHSFQKNFRLAEVIEVDELLQRIDSIINIGFLFKRVSDCSFLYWHRSLCTVYFESIFQDYTISTDKILVCASCDFCLFKLRV